MKNLLFLLFVCLSLFCCFSTVYAQGYSITKLDFTAMGINNKGQVVGSYSTSSSVRACLWQNNIITDLGTLPGRIGSHAYDINNQGQIVGDSYNSMLAPEDIHACLWQNNIITDLGTLDGNNITAYGINNKGQVVGSYFTRVGQQCAFMWQNKIMTNNPKGTAVGASKINDMGQVIGFFCNQASLWKNNTAYSLGTLGGDNSSATGINNIGQIVGVAQTSTGAYHACLWQNNIITDLGTLGGVSSKAWGINYIGQIVGDSATSTGELHAFLWKNNIMIDLNSLIPIASGWVLNYALRINDAGQIVGRGMYNGKQCSFLLTPIN